MTTSWPAASSTSIDSRVARATPPRCRPDGLGRTKAASLAVRPAIRVRSRGSSPPVRRELGSTATTATRCPRSTRRHPIASMKVDLPTPGTPVIPTRTDPPVASAMSASSSPRELAVVGPLDSSSVIARATCWRDPARTPSARSATSTARHPSRSRRSVTRSMAARLMTVPGRVDGVGAGGPQAPEVLGRDDPADDDHEVVAAEARRARARSAGHEGEVAGGERADADDVDVGLDGLARHLRRASGTAGRRRRRSRGRRRRWR